MNDEPTLLGIPAAAKWLGVSVRLTWSLLENGELRSVKVGRRRLIPRRELERFVAKGLKKWAADKDGAA